MQRGFYFISTSQIDKDGKQFSCPELQEGSYEYHGKLFIHRDIDYVNNPRKWKVSHTTSGAAISYGLTLKTARLLAKELQGFTLWDLDKYEDLQRAIRLHHLGYQEEVKRIESIRKMKAE